MLHGSHVEDEVSIKDYGSNCELILVPKSGNNIVTEEAYNAFYELMITYRYPMRYAKENQEKIDLLTVEEKLLLEQDELAFIRTQYEKKYPILSKQFEIATIPKSLYQLIAYANDLVLGSYKEHSDKLSDTVTFNFEHGEMEKICYATMKSAMKFHLRINNAVVEIRGRVAKKISDQDVTDETVVQYFLADIAAQLNPLGEEANDESKKDQFLRINKNGPDPFSLKLLYEEINSNERVGPPNNKKPLKEAFLEFTRDMVLYEWASRSKPNINYVYQGGKYAIHKDVFAKEEGISYCYSDGLFGGAVNDARTGMAFNYIRGERRATLFSITEIPKTLARSPDEVIYAPPFSILINIHGKGEFHHLRSKISESYDYKSHYGIQGFWTSENKSEISFLIFQGCKNNREMWKKVDDFQKEHSVELRSKDHYLGAEEGHAYSSGKEEQATYSLAQARDEMRKKSLLFKGVHENLRNEHAAKTKNSQEKEGKAKEKTVSPIPPHLN